MSKFDNSELIAEVNKWKIILQKSGNDHYYELAFFKIFVKFEKFLSNAFVQYSIGNKSNKNFKPKRILYFNDENHLIKILSNGGDKKYVDFIKVIERVSLGFFNETNDPFNKIFSDSKFKDNFMYMKRIRDYIAHESNESKNIYHEKVLKSNSSHNFLSIVDFLKKTKRGQNKNYYSFFIDIMVNFSNVVLKPPTN